ncbi:MAG: 16S rRNA (cytosine(1402)-N(4))-methyltransferase RsmH [Alphaproteobacteria bacterium]|nr:16S rRNA (cytosine(1402)-N(4))-methyltransferase RsmH [Alphaproteobacteria bacterium]
MASTSRHIPVMLSEVLCYLEPKDGETYVDATFGNGGYSEAILKAARCRVIAIDRDPSVIKRAEEIKKAYDKRFKFIAGTFGDLDKLVTENINGIVFDIGVSSMQLDDDFRGFSFSKEAPLDMRMSKSGISAQDIVNTYNEKALADLIYNYGEEKKSRQIAAKIVDYRVHKKIETTTELANIIYQIMPKRFGQIDPATRTFQALRIAVNDELDQLQKGLTSATHILSQNGRIVVVDFHSLEDRIVKNFFAQNTVKKIHTSRYHANDLPVCESKYFCFASKAITPTKEECALNSRARSAKLRYAIKRKELDNE